MSFLRSLYQRRPQRPAGPAGQDRRIPPRASRRSIPCTGSSPEAGSATTSRSGSAIPKTTRVGCARTPPGRSWSRKNSVRSHDPAALAKAWDEIYIAQGSDWFWWYGDDHSSALDGLFDHLFRKHLRNIYTLLGSDPPGSLFTPISRADGHRPLHDQPISFSNVKVDGRATYFEWIDAARYVCGNDRGTMTLVARGLLQSIWFGFDAERLLVRVDTEGGPAARAPGRGRSSAHRLRRPGRNAKSSSWTRPISSDRLLEPCGSPLANGTTVQAATGAILELAVPFARLDLNPGDPIRFYVELLEGRFQPRSSRRARGSSSWSPPSPDFERIMWQV